MSYCPSFSECLESRKTPDRTRTENGLYWVHYLAALGKVDLVIQAIAKNHTLDVRTIGLGGGQYPMHVASQNNQIEMLKHLLKAFVNDKNRQSAVSKRGVTPLMLICRHALGKFVIQQYISFEKFKPDTSSKDVDGNTALHHLFMPNTRPILTKQESSNVAVTLLDYLVNYHNEEFKTELKDEPNNMGQTATHHAVLTSNDVIVFVMVKRFGHDPTNQPDLLSVAIANNRFRTAMFLLEMGWELQGPDLQNIILGQDLSLLASALLWQTQSIGQNVSGNDEVLQWVSANGTREQYVAMASLLNWPTEVKLQIAQSPHQSEEIELVNRIILPKGPEWPTFNSLKDMIELKRVGLLFLTVHATPGFYDWFNTKPTKETDELVRYALQKKNPTVVKCLESIPFKTDEFVPVDNKTFNYLVTKIELSDFDKNQGYDGPFVQQDGAWRIISLKAAFFKIGDRWYVRPLTSYRNLHRNKSPGDRRKLYKGQQIIVDSVNLPVIENYEVLLRSRSLFPAFKITGQKRAERLSFKDLFEDLVAKNREEFYNLLATNRGDVEKDVFSVPLEKIGMDLLSSITLLTIDIMIRILKTCSIDLLSVAVMFQTEVLEGMLLQVSETISQTGSKPILAILTTVFPALSIRFGLVSAKHEKEDDDLAEEVLGKAYLVKLDTNRVLDTMKEGKVGRLFMLIHGRQNFYQLFRDEKNERNKILELAAESKSRGIARCIFSIPFQKEEVVPVLKKRHKAALVKLPTIGRPDEPSMFKYGFVKIEGTWYKLNLALLDHTGKGAPTLPNPKEGPPIQVATPKVVYWRRKFFPAFTLKKQAGWFVPEAVELKKVLEDSIPGESELNALERNAEKRRNEVRKQLKQYFRISSDVATEREEYEKVIYDAYLKLANGLLEEISDWRALLAAARNVELKSDNGYMEKEFLQFIAEAKKRLEELEEEAKRTQTVPDLEPFKLWVRNFRFPRRRSIDQIQQEQDTRRFEQLVQVFNPRSFIDNFQNLAAKFPNLAGADKDLEIDMKKEINEAKNSVMDEDVVMEQYRMRMVDFT